MDFPSTIWTAIRDAERDPSGAQDRIVRRYREPVLRYLMTKGLSPEDAEDLTQNIFLHLCKGRLLERADRSKGRFRALLMAVTTNLLKMWRRGEYAGLRQGSGRVISLDNEMLVGLADASSSGVPEDQSFNQTWAANVMQHALDRLKEEGEKAGKLYYRAAQGFYLLGWDYGRIAKELGTDKANVKNYVFRAKERLRELMCVFIKEYCGSQEEYDDELADLKDLIFGGA